MIPMQRYRYELMVNRYVEVFAESAVEALRKIYHLTNEPPDARRLEVLDGAVWVPV